jgi:hypothetical protein
VYGKDERRRGAEDRLDAKRIAAPPSGKKPE